MFHIAILDDTEMCLNMTVEMIQDYIYEKSAVDMDYKAFLSPMDLMDEVESGADFDAFLLDIMMPGITGIEVAKELRKMGIGVPIIFITSEKGYALDAFQVGASQYLLKGFSYADLRDTLDKAMQIVSKERRRHVVLCTRKGYRHIFCRNIVYCVANKNYQSIVLDSSEVLEVRMSHKALKEKLTQSINFVSVGSSYVVNMFYISELTAETLTMMDSYVIQIPQRQSRQILAAYASFFAELGRVRPHFQIN